MNPSDDTFRVVTNSDEELVSVVGGAFILDLVIIGRPLQERIDLPHFVRVVRMRDVGCTADPLPHFLRAYDRVDGFA